MSKRMSEAERFVVHDCASSHHPRDLACPRFEMGMNGRCVFCDHESRCHPGPNKSGPLGARGVHDVIPEGSRGSRVKDTASESIHEQAKAKAQAKRDRKAAKRSKQKA